MDCNTALQIMLDNKDELRAEALAYIMQSPECLARLDQLARAILTDLDDEMPCAEVRPALAAYYVRTQAGANVREEMTAIHGHMQRCPYCQFELQILAEIMEQQAQNQLPALETLAPLDLAFLEELAPLQPPTLWIIQEQMRTLFRQLEIGIHATRAAIAALTPDLTPLNYVTTMRGQDDVHYAVLILPDQDAQLHFQVEAKPTADGAAVIALHIFDTQTDSPIADVRVTLRTADRSLVAGSLTDAKGAVEFPRIAPNHYVIQAQHANMIWELPVAITRL